MEGGASAVMQPPAARAARQSVGSGRCASMLVNTFVGATIWRDRVGGAFAFRRVYRGGQLRGPPYASIHDNGSGGGQGRRVGTLVWNRNDHVPPDDNWFSARPPLVHRRRSVISKQPADVSPQGAYIVQTSARCAVAAISALHDHGAGAPTDSVGIGKHPPARGAR